MESAKLIADLTLFFVEMVRRILEAVTKLGEEYDAASLEEFVREQSRALGAVVFEYCWALRCRELGRPASVPCSCGRRRVFKGRAERAIRTTLGEMNLPERFRYRCPVCGDETILGDELRGEGNFSELAERLIAYAGQAVGGMFAQAAKTLKRFLGIEVRGKTVENVCLRRGRRLIAAQEHSVAAPHEVKPEDRPRRIVVGVDGSLIGRVDPAHRKRSSAKTGKVPGKGKLANFWKEVKTCVVYAMDAAGKAVGRKTYYSTQAAHDVFGYKVLTEALRRGLHTAGEVVFIGDGAKWIWNLCAREFKKAVQVLDWYHAVEHLWEAGRAYFGETSEMLTPWVKAREGELYEGCVEKVIAAVGAMADEVGVAPKGAAETDPRVILRRNVGYFEDNSSRMNYPEYRKRGIPTGSGVVESACRHVVASRPRQFSTCGPWNSVIDGTPSGSTILLRRHNDCPNGYTLPRARRTSFSPCGDRRPRERRREG
jgi:hypothetical protein